MDSVASLNQIGEQSKLIIIPTNKTRKFNSLKANLYVGWNWMSRHIRCRRSLNGTLDTTNNFLKYGMWNFEWLKTYLHRQRQHAAKFSLLGRPVQFASSRRRRMCLLCQLFQPKWMELNRWRGLPKRKEWSCFKKLVEQWKMCRFQETVAYLYCLL